MIHPRTILDQGITKKIDGFSLGDKPKCVKMIDLSSNKKKLVSSTVDNKKSKAFIYWFPGCDYDAVIRRASKTSRTAVKATETGHVASNDAFGGSS